MIATIILAAASCAAEVFGPLVKTGELPGVVSVLYNNGVEEVECLGYADVAAKRKITMDDAFEQMSQTKGFCGVALAKLIEEGKIQLDDPVSKYLFMFNELWVKDTCTNGVKTLKKAKNTLTIRMIMNHTGGLEYDLPNFVAMGGYPHRMPLVSVATIAATLPLKFEPGTGVQYSNLGIDIGAVIVEKVTKMPFEEYIKKNIIDPLGMKETTFYPSQQMLAKRIELYKLQKGGKAAVWMKNHNSDPSARAPDAGRRNKFPSAGAGLWTTARDQLKFYKMLMNLGVGDNGARILKEETVKKYLAVNTRQTDKERWYSMGLTAPGKDNEDGWFGHGGAWQTQCLVNYHKKQLRLYVVQVCGAADFKMTELYDKAADAFFKKKIDNSKVNEYTGRTK